MLHWFAVNIGTVIITLLLIAIVALIIIKLVRDKKKGVSSCGGNCPHCTMHCAYAEKSSELCAVNKAEKKR